MVSPKKRKPAAAGVRDTFTVHIKVIPGAKTNRLWYEGEQLKCRLQAPAVDGKANVALIEFCSTQWGIPKRSIQIIRGEHGREKWLRIEGGYEALWQRKRLD